MPVRYRLNYQSLNTPFSSAIVLNKTELIVHLSTVDAFEIGMMQNIYKRRQRLAHISPYYIFAED